MTMWCHCPGRQRRTGRLGLGAGIVLALLVVGCGSPAGNPATTAPSSSGPAAGGSAPSNTAGTQPALVPAPARTVVVVMENHSYSDIIANPDAPYINQLASHGAVFTESHAITHPSEPNYLALFSGSTQGVADDGCSYRFSTPNLATDLMNAGKSFAGYAEDLPTAGAAVCSAGEYARKHVPWADFSNVPSSVSMPFSSFGDGGFARLPTVSFIIPNMCDDMHDCSVSAGDSWLRSHMGSYADWAMTHDSLLILTWDEDDGSQGNQIPTIFAGQPVRPGHYAQPVTHYSVLATIDAAYGLAPDGQAAAAAPVTSVWGR